MAIKGRTQRLWDGTLVGLSCGGYTNPQEIKGHRRSTRTLQLGGALDPSVRVTEAAGRWVLWPPNCHLK